jgi:aspartyl-tRNA(Asn)/glutamyl-tRNA(Gln) amidotransferase subunit A
MDLLPSAWQVADAVRARKLSAREAVDEALKRIEERNAVLNAFVYLDPQGARQVAAEIDAAISRGEDPGPLAGVPIGVKDLAAVAGMPHTLGSRAWASQVAAADSIEVARLRAAGAVVVGKTNTPEFGYKGFTENLLFGATGNPWNPALTPGGSSGGSASAVTAGMVPLCTGSDGGGSIRIPAALSGCYGIKPSAGRVPRASDTSPHWGSHTALGPLSRTVRDAARYLDVAAGPHPNDMDSLDSDLRGYEAAVLAGAPRLRRIAWSEGLGYGEVEPELREITMAAARALAEAVGAELVEADPAIPNPMSAWYTLAAPGDARVVDSLTPEQRELLEPGFQAFAERARAITGVEMASAAEVRHQVNRGLTAFFEQYDLLCTPTLAITAFPKQGPMPSRSDGKSAMGAALPVFNLTGHPAASLPAGLAANGLPVGLQVVGPRWADRLVLAASAAYESARPWSWPPAYRNV